MTNYATCPASIIEIMHVDDRNVRAIATIKIEDLILRVRIVQQSNQRAYVAWPSLTSRQYGKPAYFNIIELPEDLKRYIDRMILEAYRG